MTNTQKKTEIYDPKAAKAEASKNYYKRKKRSGQVKIGAFLDKSTMPMMNIIAEERNCTVSQLMDDALRNYAESVRFRGIKANTLIDWTILRYFEQIAAERDMSADDLINEALHSFITQQGDQKGE